MTPVTPPHLQPGPDLAATISDGLNDGRPGVFIGAVRGSDSGLGVPRASLRPNGPGRFDFYPGKSPWSVPSIPPKLAVFLETGHQGAMWRAGAHEVTAGRRLYAAALRDILGMSEEEVAESCAWNERTTRRAIEKARPLWHELGGWPWCCFAAGALPRDWRSSELDWPVQRVFNAWLKGSL